MQIDPAGLEPRDLYRLMITLVVPRPIAWVSTRGPDGAANAAPFSYFQALSSAPPMVMIAVGKKRGGVFKDTRANIEATGEFVVNVVSEDSAARMVKTSVAYDYGVSEFDEVGLEAAPAERVKAPRIAESPVSLECRLDRVLEVGTSGVLIGEVVLFHVRDDVLAADGTADPAKLRPLGRLGGACYAPLREVLEITPDSGPSTVAGELLDFWRELRERTIAVCRACRPEHLGRRLGRDGDTVGRIFRHIAAATTWILLHLAGREDEDEHRVWDGTWTPERLATELEEDRDRFLEGIRGAGRRDLVRRMIRHEAWHQGQIAAALRGDFAPDEVWRL